MTAAWSVMSQAKATDAPYRAGIASFQSDLNAIQVTVTPGKPGAPPTVLKDDYAKWMLDDPRVNFAISTRGAAPGL